MEEVQGLLIEQIEGVKALEQNLQVVESELKLNPQFAKFLEMQKQYNEKASEVWKIVETTMVDLYKEGKIEKTLKGDFGTLTVTETQLWDINEEELPAKFFKKVVNTTRITDTYRLEGKAPKGCTPSIRYGLTKRLK